MTVRSIGLGCCGNTQMNLDELPVVKSAVTTYVLRIESVSGEEDWQICTISKGAALEFLQRFDHEGSTVHLMVFYGMDSLHRDEDILDKAVYAYLMPKETDDAV